MSQRLTLRCQCGWQRRGRLLHQLAAQWSEHLREAALATAYGHEAELVDVVDEADRD